MADRQHFPLWRPDFLAILLLATACGCGGDPQAHVTGLVTLDGEPLPTGTVTFYPAATGRPAYGQIAGTGRYEMHVGNEAGLPPGEYQVTVVAHRPPIMPAGDGMPMPGKSLLPAHFSRVEASGLRYTAQPGDQTHDIALTSVAR